MRSNAGMTNREGDVDLGEAQGRRPPVNTLAWLAINPATPRKGYSRCPRTEAWKASFVYFSRNILNLAASSQRKDRANRQLPFNYRKRYFNFQATVSVSQDSAFRPKKLKKCATNWAAELTLSVWKNNCKQNNYLINLTIIGHCTMKHYDLQIIQPNGVVLKSQLLPKNMTLKPFQVCYRVWSGMLSFESVKLLRKVRNYLPNDISQKIWTLPLWEPGVSHEFQSCECVTSHSYTRR